MCRKKSFLLVVIVALVSMMLPVGAAPLFDVDFNDDTVGGSITVAASVAGTVNAKPTQVVAGPGCSVTADDGTNYSAFSGFGDGVFAVMVDPTTSYYSGMKWWGHPDDAVTSGQASVSFDMQIDSASDRSMAWGFYSKDDAGKILNMIAFQIADTKLNLSIAEYSAPSVYQSSTTAGTLSLDTSMAIDILYDMTVGNVSAYIDGDLAATVSMPTTSNLCGFDLLAGKSTLGTIAIDNFQVVPEPATMLLLSLGVIGLAKRRR